VVADLRGGLGPKRRQGDFSVEGKLGRRGYIGHRGTEGHVGTVF
jgi:hypothetical protein